MSLLRLLTAGKSLVGMEDPAPRYRVTRQRLLPKFGSRKNPFRGASQPGPVQPAPAPARARGWRRILLGIDERAERLAESAGRWKVKLDSMLPTWGKKAARPAIARFAKLPVQEELSLERIRVVRNDLSDADLEIVVAGQPSGAKPRVRGAADKTRGHTSGVLTGAGQNLG